MSKGKDMNNQERGEGERSRHRAIRYEGSMMMENQTRHDPAKNGLFDVAQKERHADQDV